MESTKKREISGGTLKWIAAVTMFIDHAALVFFTTWYWPLRRAAGIHPSITKTARTLYWVLRGVGRLSFPIFCFLLVEGFFHTRDLKKYMGRLLVFGVLSEIPFDAAFERLWFDWGHQNVYFTLFLGLLSIWLWDVLVKRPWKGLSPPGRGCRLALGAVCVGICAYAAQRFHTDYRWIGVLTIFSLYVFREEEFPRAAAAGSVILGSGIIEAASWPDLILFHFYNGERGRQPKYFFYLFYPGHMVFLALVRYLFTGLAPLK